MDAIGKLKRWLNINTPRTRYYSDPDYINEITYAEYYKMLKKVNVSEKFKGRAINYITKVDKSNKIIFVPICTVMGHTPAAFPIVHIEHDEIILIKKSPYNRANSNQYWAFKHEFDKKLLIWLNELNIDVEHDINGRVNFVWSSGMEREE